MTALIRKTLYLAAGHRRWPWLLVVALAIVMSVIEAVGAALIFGLLALITNPNRPIDIPIVGDPRRLLGGGETDEAIIVGALVVAAFFIVRAVIFVGMSYIQARVTQSAGARLAARLHNGYLRLPYIDSIGINSAQQIRNIQDTVPRIVSDVFVQGTRTMSESIILLALSVVLVATSPLAMAVLLAVVVPIVLTFNHIVRPRLESLGRATQDRSRESLQVLQETLHGSRELRIHQREKHFATAFASIRHSLAQTRCRRAVLQGIPNTLLETALVLFISTFLIITVLSDSEAAAVLPVLGMFAYVGFRLKPSLSQVVEGVNSFRYSAAAIDDLHRDLDQSEKWLEGTNNETKPIAFQRGIKLSSVSFSYPGSVTPALEGIELEIPRGSSVGFVGPTGGGKSTLLDIIVGLLDPDEGNVQVDGVDIRHAKASWFRHLGVVSQSVFLLDTSIRKNIALGIPDHEIDEARIAEVLRLAKLDDFVSGLPEGTNTVLGEHGVRLSGGQRQRIAIARALYADPDALILDEGTAALDNQTEAELMSALSNLPQQCTLLMVAHRLSTVRDCDAIYLIDNGRIVASGSYLELKTKSAQFQELTK
jgi:ATP-binding cassette, subfamily B, bacterial PglK